MTARPTPRARLVPHALSRTRDGMPYASIVVVEGDGDPPVAYANVCPHRAIPLDAPDPGADLLTPDGRHLVCHSHGAIFRIDDGVCVEGACVGAALFPVKFG